MKPLLVKYLLCVMLFCMARVSQGQQIREVPDSVVRAMKNSEAFKYANDPSFWERNRLSQGDPAIVKLISKLLQSEVLKWLLFLLLTALLAYVIYRIIVVNNLFAPSRKGGKKNIERPGGDEPPDNIDEMIAAAISAREYRLAIRYCYLKTLAHLNAKQKIQLRAKFTNYDYVQQMNGVPGANEFKQLTGIYEYVWYGEFQPDREQFDTIRAGFNQFNERI